MNKLLQYMIGAGNVSDKFLPHLSKAQKGRTFPAETLESRKKAYRTIRPSDYYEMSNYTRWLFDNEREDFDDDRSEEAFRMYLGMENNPKYFRQSKYKPTINRDPNPSTYYQVDPQLEQEIFESFKDKVKLNEIRKANETQVKSQFDENDPNVWTENGRQYKQLVPGDRNMVFGRPMVSNARALGNFVVSRGKDKQGEYLSYSDNYDFPGWAQERMQGQPYKIYGRVYYPKTKQQYGGVPVTSRGQYDYPGRDTLVPTPTGQITMQGVPYPVYGEDETGYGQMMMPGGEYEFPGQMVYEKPMMQKGGPAPIFVSDPKDSRLKNYEDSLYNYNLGRRMAAVLDADKNLFKVHPGSDYDRALQAKVKGAGNKFIDNSEIDAGGYKNFEKIGSIMKEYQKRGNKAILPIRYQGYFPDPDNSIVDMVTLRSVWDALGVTDPRPPGAANLPEWKKPERQVVYKPTDPVPPAPRKTDKKPSGADTLFVNNPNDPRLKAYQDSLSAFSLDKAWENYLKTVPDKKYTVEEIERLSDKYRVPATKASVWDLGILDKRGIRKVDYERSIVSKSGEPRGYYSSVYKKPVQPVVYRKPQSPASVSFNTTKEMDPIVGPALPQLFPRTFTPNYANKSRAVDFWNPSMSGGVQGGWHRRLFDSMEEADNFMKYIRENDLSQGYEVTNSGVNKDADKVSYGNGGVIPKAQFGAPSFFSGVPMLNMAAKLYNKFMTPSPKVTPAPVVAEKPKPQDNLSRMYDMNQKVSSRFYDQFNKNDRLPSDSSQMINLSAGRFKGAKVPAALVKDMVNSAKRGEVDPWEFVSVVGRESTYASGQYSNQVRGTNKRNLVSGWNVDENYAGYSPARFLADKKVPGVKTRKDFHGWNYDIIDRQATQDYLNKHPEIVEQYQKKLSTIPQIGDLNSFDLAARRIKQKGLKNYNPGDPNYEAMIREDMKLLKSDKEMAAMMRSLGYKNGGQYGGLDRWFAEKWVDVKTGKDCGRQEGEKRGYPACRPSRRVSSETPKTSSEMSPAEKARFKRTKTSSERIPYNHKRK